MNEYEKAWAKAKEQGQKDAAKAAATNAADTADSEFYDQWRASNDPAMRAAANMQKQAGEYQDRVRENAGKTAQLNAAKEIARGAATTSTVMAAPTRFTGQELDARNSQVMGWAKDAGAGYDAAANRAMGGAGQQAALGEMIRASAMGQGPSVAGIQGGIQGDRMIRGAAGAASGSMLAQRGAASGLAMGGNDLAAGVAGARAQEQMGQQSALAQNIRAMQSANISAAGMASDRQLGFRGQADADVFGNASLEQKANLANFESEEQMRARAARALLVQMGRDDARAAQSQANRQANAQAAIAGGTMAAGAAADAWGEWKSREKGKKK